MTGKSPLIFHYSHTKSKAGLRLNPLIGAGDIQALRFVFCMMLCMQMLCIWTGDYDWGCTITFNFLLHFDKIDTQKSGFLRYVLIKMIQKLWSGDLFIYKCHVPGGLYLSIYFIYLFIFGCLHFFWWKIKEKTLTM